MSPLPAAALIAVGLLVALAIAYRLRSVRAVPSGSREARHGSGKRNRSPAVLERERLAEERAEELLRSVVGEDDWQAYQALGYLYAYGPSEDDGQPGYGYLIYPHRPMVSFDARSGRLLNELCVSFPELERDRDPDFDGRLPDADDVLAKWMAIRGDELALLAEANVLPPGRQIDPDQARRDIARLGEWSGRPSGDHAAS